MPFFDLFSSLACCNLDISESIEGSLAGNKLTSIFSAKMKVTHRSIRKLSSIVASIIHRMQYCDYAESAE